MNAPLILISNDDGITAEGLKALCEAMLPLGEVVVMAPEVERSAMGHAITLSDPLRVSPSDMGMDGVTAYACSGTPADCVKLAIRAILPRKPDLVVSGINHGSNTGVNVIYSGTVSAATEGTIMGVPSVAFSLACRNCDDFSPAQTIARHIAGRVLTNGLPPGTLLNVNIPDQPAGSFPEGNLDGSGYELTVHGKADWEDDYDKRVDPHNRIYYWLSGRRRDVEEQSHTDEQTLRAGKVSITPLHYDLTAHHFSEELSRWSLFKRP